MSEDAFDLDLAVALFLFAVLLRLDGCFLAFDFVTAAAVAAVV